MVDLVKIRKKAKEKKETEDAATVSDSPDTPAAEEKKAPDKPRRKTPAKNLTPHKPVDQVEPKPAPEPKPKPKPKPRAKPKSKPPDKEAEAAPPEPEAVSLVVAADKNEPVVAEAKPGDLKDAVELAAVAEKSSEAGAVQYEPVQPEVDEKSINRLEKFKQEAGRRRSWAIDATRSDSAKTDEDESSDLELLRFKLAGEEYAVDIENIVEIVPPRGTTRVPNADQAIVGIMSLRGTIVTVFDLRSKLGHPPVSEEPDIDPRMIVVERAGETAGFLVDRVSRVVKLDPSELESHPVVSAAEQSDYVGGVFQASDGLVILLDLEKILASHN